VAQKDLSASLNAIAGLTITFIPYFITRKLDIPHYTGLTLWITLAIFLHSIGNFALYDNIAGWDNVTHALSASVVAAAGYTIIRAIDIYIDEIYIPPKVLFIFILLFVLASGVLWEIFEFLIDELTTMFGYEASMTQYGINDTMTDLLFDLLGAVLAATWATAYLSDISYRLADRFEKMSAKKR
jgi:asparagine N-glycosylation enzyme membrane subunit Stt3